MVGTCPHCNRPWFGADDKPLPSICKGCNKPLQSGSPNAGHDQVPSNQPMNIADEVAKINARVEEQAVQGSLAQVATWAFAAGVCLLLLAMYWAFLNYSFISNAREVVGIVKDVEYWQSSKRSKSIYQIEYFAGGKKQLLRSAAGQTDYNKGDQVKLLVSPTDPTDARHPDTSTMWGWQIALAIFGGLCIIFGLVMRPKAEPSASLAETAVSRPRP